MRRQLASQEPPVLPDVRIRTQAEGQQAELQTQIPATALQGPRRDTPTSNLANQILRSQQEIREQMQSQMGHLQEMHTALSNIISRAEGGSGTTENVPPV